MKIKKGKTFSGYTVKTETGIGFKVTKLHYPYFSKEEIKRFNMKYVQFRLRLLYCRIERKIDAFFWKLGEKKRKKEGYERYLHNHKTNENI